MSTRFPIRSRGRGVAVAGAVVAVSAATLMTVAVAASAAEAGTCTQHVNVRAEPEPGARIVGLCKAGTQVEVGETRNGFVRLPDLDGWAMQQYVAVDGRPADPVAAGAPAKDPAALRLTAPTDILTNPPTTAPERKAATSRKSTPANVDSTDDHSATDEDSDDSEDS